MYPRMNFLCSLHQESTSIHRQQEKQFFRVNSNIRIYSRVYLAYVSNLSFPRKISIKPTGGGGYFILDTPEAY